MRVCQRRKRGIVLNMTPRFIAFLITIMLLVFWFHEFNPMKNIINQENVIFYLDLRISASRLQSTKTIMIKFHHEIAIS